MDNIKISPWQLFTLITLFGWGTSLVVPYGMNAGQDAWIAALLGLSAGLVVLQVYLYLYVRYPGLSLIGYTKKIMGKYAGWTIGLLYVLVFIYECSTVLRRCGDLLLNAVYDETPLFVLNALMVVSVAYVAYKGIEVLARTAGIYLIFLIFLGILGVLLIVSGGILEGIHLLPVMEKGVKPIVSTVFLETYGFPFGQMIVITMLLPYVNKRRSVKKVAHGAMAATGFVLSITIAIEISVLGVQLTQQSTFPLLVTISMVDVADFLQRLDAIVVFTLIITVFFKIAVFYYVAVMGASELFDLPKPRQLILPVGFIILVTSMTIADNYSEYLMETTLYNSRIGIFFYAVIPLLLSGIDLIRRRVHGKKGAERSGAA
ncbi:GerAB/ArcD/ProY family transporter [Paenibacillus sp. GYB003]|uniref:GerAB/ArcD/ProY family transporter n=1 Tax=Paenibacillus sp. GYB003 TaxID=2994392 RepID=UPI002F962950